MSEPLGLLCPLCRYPALPLPFLAGQAFCSNAECRVMCWDPGATLAEFHEQATAIDLGVLE